jgi:hypothetical protein
MRLPQALQATESLSGTPDTNPLPISMRQKRSFLAASPAPPRINRLARTKTPGKTFAVLAGFCHSEA